MYDVNAKAIRNGKSIEVIITGMLANSCHQAKIVDYYPGGNIVYIKDPGAAQVFIEETHKPSTSFCLMMLIPWAGSISIADSYHDKVEVYVNNQEQIEVEVLEKDTDFEVCQLTGGIVPNGNCSILPAGMCKNEHPFKKVFGPAKYDECNQYVEDHCP